MIDIIKIQSAVAEMDQVTVKGGGKYTQVAQRVEVFRKHIGDQLGMESDIVVDDGKRVVIKATIRSRDGFVVATGWAEELRGSNPVNKMACIENTETSAYGRALANLGIHGGEFASDNEIDKAKRNDKIVDEREADEIDEPKADKPATPTVQEIPFDPDIWSQWVNEQMVILRDATKVKLLLWSRKTKQKRDQLVEADRELNALLNDYYQERYDELNTGER
jgi:hypothetical protein